MGQLSSMFRINHTRVYFLGVFCVIITVLAIGLRYRSFSQSIAASILRSDGIELILSPGKPVQSPLSSLLYGSLDYDFVETAKFENISAVADVKRLSVFPRLRRCIISKCEKPELIIESLSKNCGAIQSLSIYDCSLPPGCIHDISKMDQLEELSIMNALFNADDFRHVQKLTKLKRLSLQGKHVDGRVLSLLSQCESIQFVGLISVNISDDDLSSLCNMDQLVRLSILKTTIEGTGFACFTADSHLTWLNLNGCFISTQGLQVISKLKSLEYLSLEDTGLGTSDIEAVRSELQTTDVNSSLKSSKPE